MAEVQALALKSVGQQQEEIQKAVAARDAELKPLRGREDALATREKDLALRVKIAAESKALELVAAECQEFEQQLAEKSSQAAALRKEREKLKDEKAALALEVRKQLDALIIHGELSTASSRPTNSRPWSECHLV